MEFKIPQKVKDFLKKIFTKERLPIILLVGVLFVVISIPVKKTDKSQNTENEYTEYNREVQHNDYVTDIEKRLEDILRNTSGVGQNKVMITIRNTGKDIIYSQMDVDSVFISETDASGNRVTEELSQKESVIYTEENGISKPFIQDEEMPEILGVLIIAQGAGEPSVVREITQAASVLLGIPVNKIKVMKMEVGS